MPDWTLNNVLLAVAGIGTTITALRLGAYKALKEDLNTYKGRVETLEAELARMKTERAADQEEMRRLRDRTDMTPITELLSKLCAQHDEHGKVLEHIATETTALATTFSEVLAPKIRQSVEKDSQ